MMGRIRIAETEKGQVEYTFEGVGPTVLIVHGGHASCRSHFKQQSLIENGFSVLIPTRPGYRGTPIESGKTVAATADLLAALLKELKIERVKIIGVSAGGPTALEFSKRYADMTERLVLESAIVKPWFHKLTCQYWGSKYIFNPKRQKAFWDNLKEQMKNDEYRVLRKNIKLFTRLDPDFFLKRLNSDEIAELKEALVEGNDSGTGFIYDVEHRAHEIEKIQCPVLIIHSENDGSVSFSHAVFAHKKIKNSELYIAPNDSHFLYIGPGSKEVLKKRIDFLSGNGDLE